MGESFKRYAQQGRAFAKQTLLRVSANPVTQRGISVRYEKKSSLFQVFPV